MAANEAVNRYSRQELIEGWDQSKLTNAKIGIVGSDHIASFLGTSLAALGVGEITLYDDATIDYAILGKANHEREFLLVGEREGSSKVEALERQIQNINPLVRVSGMHMTLDDLTESLIEKPNLMVMTTNSFEKAHAYAAFCNRNKIDFYATAGDRKGVLFNRFHRGMSFPDYSAYEQDPITSEVISGILSGEILQELMNKNGIRYLTYAPAGRRFNCDFEKDIVLGDLTKKRVLMIGAGALGNFAGIGLAQANIGYLYPVDNDTVDSTNLNRQIMFHDSVGKRKAEVLAQRLNEINPGMKIEPLYDRVSEKFESKLEKIKPDVILDCVDNLSTRAILNYFALKNNIPIVSGGTDYHAGQVIVFQPGKSLCLDCRLGANKALREERRSNSCIRAPTPSVVVTNHIIGGLMAAETRCVLDPENYGEAARKTIKYDYNVPNRIGLVGAEGSCTCKPDLFEKEVEEKKMETEKQIEKPEEVKVKVMELVPV